MFSIRVMMSSISYRLPNYYQVYVLDAHYGFVAEPWLGSVDFSQFPLDYVSKSTDLSFCQPWYYTSQMVFIWKVYLL